MLSLYIFIKQKDKCQRQARKKGMKLEEKSFIKNLKYTTNANRVQNLKQSQKPVSREHEVFNGEKKTCKWDTH